MTLAVFSPSNSFPRVTHAPCRLAAWVLLAVVPLVRPALASEPFVSPLLASLAAPRIEFPVATHHFGSVPKGQVVRHDFKVLNTGTAPLEITGVQPACGCTTAGEWTRRIPPGGTGTIPLQLETAQFTGPITKTITITSNDPAHKSTVLEITATVWTPIQVSQPVVIFPAVTQLDQVGVRSVTIRHQVDGVLKLAELKSDRPEFQPVLKEIVPGREFELTISTVPPLANGTITGRISMITSNPAMPEIVVQAVVTVLPPVQVAPTELMLTTAKLAAAEKKYVVVLNHRGGDLKLSELKTNAPGVTIATTATADGKQFTIALTFPAGFELNPAEKLTFSGKTNHPELPAFEVPIVLVGNR